MQMLVQDLQTSNGSQDQKENWNAATLLIANVSTPCTGATAVDMHTALTADLTARHVITTSATIHPKSESTNAAKDSTFSVADLVFDTLGQEAYFGSRRAEQSDCRRSAFDDLIDKCHEGTKVGNSYLQSLLKHMELKNILLQNLFMNCLIDGEYLHLREHFRQ